MIKKILIFLLICLFVISACKKVEYDQNVSIDSRHENKQILFFSDKENISKEGNYYDALLEIKREYPSAVDGMQVISKATAGDLHEYYGVSSLPSIVIVYDRQVLFRIVGEVDNKEEIIKPIKKVLSN